MTTEDGAQAAPATSDEPARPAAAPPMPADGGRYMRDPVTGALTRLDDAADAAQPAPDAAPGPDPEPASEPAPRRWRRRGDLEI